MELVQNQISQKHSSITTSQKLTITQVVNKFSKFHGTQKFITVFVTAHQGTLP